LKRVVDALREAVRLCVSIGRHVVQPGSKASPKSLPQAVDELRVAVTYNKHSGARRRRMGNGPEGCALACISAPTMPWALVNLMPCHAWHVMGLSELPAATIRGINSRREAIRRVFGKS
jgi:hypothetical protein